MVSNDKFAVSLVPTTLCLISKGLVSDKATAQSKYNLSQFLNENFIVCFTTRVYIIVKKHLDVQRDLNAHLTMK